MPQAQLRPSSAADAAFIYRVYERTARPLVEAAGRKWAGPGMLAKSQTEAADALTCIIQCCGVDSGMFRVEPRAQALWLDLLFLLPEYQHLGLGTQLLHGVHQRSAQTCVPARLQVMSFNPAQHYYAARGYRITHEEGLVISMERAP